MKYIFYIRVRLPCRIQIMKMILPVLLLALLAACAAQKESAADAKGAGDTRTRRVESLDDYTYLLKEKSTDSSYAYTPENPVKVGGVGKGNGPENEHRYLRALLGPNGEDIHYHRSGSCCGFKTPNAFIGDMGLLDKYMVYWEGAEDTLKIYINMYDEGDLLIPFGLTAKQK